MKIGATIKTLRQRLKMSQERFAEILDVSRQSVQKWESDAALPELEKLIKISKQFGISLDTLILGNDARTNEEIKTEETVKPKYTELHDYGVTYLQHEYTQCIDEGLDVQMYKDVFDIISQTPYNELREKFDEVLLSICHYVPTVENYPYEEPSTLDEIKALRKEYAFKTTPIDEKTLENKITGAWLGRICGCLLGKPVEGVRTDDLIPFLKESGNYPLHRYVRRSDIPADADTRYKFPFESKKSYIDDVSYMPPDDDTNYTVLAQCIIEEYGKDFTPYNISRAWLHYQPRDVYWTAERVAYHNFIKGFTPPASATNRNTYREWIGAQIRGDYFGYINPANPELAADMAFRDASVSHIKNGIYGEMFVAAMLANAVVTDDLRDIILSGLAQIPYTSRFYEAIMHIVAQYDSGVSCDDCFKDIHKRWDEHSGYGWCHVIPNAMIVVASLLYGNGDFGKSICLSVETGFDTDCNGATVGSVLGMARGSSIIGEEWTAPLGGMLHTNILGKSELKIADVITKTMQHIRMLNSL